MMNRDIHAANVGVIYTKPKKINILNYKIKNYGYKIVMIDYEDMFKINDNDYIKNKENTNGTYYFMIKYQNIIINFTDFEEYNSKYIKKNRTQFIDFIPDKKYKEKIQKYLPNEEIYNIELIENTLYKILYQEEYQKQILKNNFTKFIPFKLLLPLDTILFIIKNMKHPDVILYFLLANTKYKNIL